MSIFVGRKITEHQSEDLYSLGLNFDYRCHEPIRCLESIQLTNQSSLRSFFFGRCHARWI